MEFLRFLTAHLSLLASLRHPALHHQLSIFADLGFALLLLLVALAKRVKPRPACSVSALRVWFKLLALNCAYISFLQLLVLGYEMVQAMNKQFDIADYSALCVATVHGVSWALLTFMVFRFRKNALRKVPLLIRIWWFLSFLLCIYTIVVDSMALVHRSCHINLQMVANFAAGPTMVFLFVASVRGVTGVEVDLDPLCMQDPLLSEGAEDEEGERQVEREVLGCETVTPYANAGLFSIISLGWMNPLLRVGAKRPLEMDDIPKLAKTDRAKTSYKIVMSEWEKMKSENPCRQPSLVLVILQSFKREAAINAVFVLLSTLSTYVAPYLISYFVAYLSGQTLFQYEGCVLALIFLLSKVSETLFTRQWYVRVDVMGMHVKSALTAMVYRKGLRLAVTARQKHTSGEIVNYMAVDVQRIGEFAWYMHDTWILPLQIALAMFNLYRSVGLACIASFLTTILSILLTVPLANLQEKFQDSLMEAKDERMRKTSECLKSMRVLKLQAWDERFRAILEEMRSVEFRWLRKSLYTQALVTFIFWGSPIFVSAATFGTSIYLGHELTAGAVLSALATFRILQDPLRNFPDLVSNLTQTKVSLDRIARFLEEEELRSDTNSRIPLGETNNAIEIENGDFTWNPVSSIPTLTGIQLLVQRGMRVAVCGAVGAGKSSFLSCILGEMPKVSGQVKTSGSIAYVPQSAWILSGNIETNILFGSPMDRDRYNSVLHACSLLKDLELFSHGDQTVIGDRGINLSGGQKQRIQLARALYQDADIYLLDDPFSAVDAETGSELFREYITSALAEKTVIFVTHQVEFLPASDLILVFKDGRIIQEGKYEDMLEAGTDLSTLIAAHHEAMEGMDVGTSDSSINSSESASISEDHSIIEENNDDNVSITSMRERTLTSRNSSVDHMVEEISTIEEKRLKKEKKKAMKAQMKQLVQDEERLRGKISFKVYLSYIAAAYRGLLIPLIILAQTAFQVLQLGGNWWMTWANPLVEGDAPKVNSMITLIVYMALAFGSSWFVFIRSILVATFGLAAAQKMFFKMLTSIFRAPMSFFDSTPAGRILNRVSVDQSIVDTDIPFRLGGFSATTIQVICIISVMMNATWQVVFVFFPVVIISLCIQKYYMNSSRELARIVSIQKSPIIHLFEESIAGASAIRAFGQEKRFMKKNLHLIDSYNRPFFYSFTAIEWLCLRMELLSTFVFAFCMVFLVTVPRGTIDASMAGFAVTTALNLNNRLSKWILSFCKLENKVIAIERINQYSEIPPEPPLIIENCRPPSCWPPSGTIEIIDLTVRYKEHLPTVLHGISCIFPGGKKVGIVGRTGSGKSTLIQALFRLVEPLRGSIVIDGLDISTIGLHDLRSRLSIIPQDPTLFEGTVRINLDPLGEHSDSEIWQALDKCQLGDAIRESDSKLDAPVLENGDNWSVGQRQLLSLGRALLKQAQILVLDEATASVDTTTDNLIQGIIRTEFKDCTVCTIAHRIPTVIDSDLVLVLSDGRIAEYDSPQNLLEDRNSMFMKLVSEYLVRSSSIA
ncbi:ABC transporter C family member 5 [Rhynchospora pubera]|uniref:ABC transporter C family member 5 n=1 Tax=Rhynchospora pubera TaxID=906938 RepID=A0AAV8GG26_9POAL|nr:ABC transporter C family member 5 [Rhynchospora pubera]